MLDRLASRDGLEVQFSETAAANGDFAELAGERRSVGSGDAKSVIRPHALTPTTIAPTTANASRQPCDGMQISAKPSVA
jgi:hypothetical protein